MSLDNKRAVFGWAMYDWANSAFATTIMAGFFPLFFKQYWSSGVDVTTSTARLGLANSISGLAVALAAPILGAIADRGGTKKRFLLYFAYMGAMMTSALFMVSKGHWGLAILLYLLANVGFSGGNIFYDSLLTAVADEKRMDMVSALGFAFGYLGGGLLFALNVWTTLKPESFGFADAGEAVRFSFLSVGIWWAVFSLPLLVLVKEPPLAHPKRGTLMLKAGFSQLRETISEIRHMKTIFLFLLAYWLYMDGVDTVIRMAVDYGISIGLDAKDLISALLITQFVGFPSALGFGFLGQKIGAKRAIFIAILVYLTVSVWGAFMRHEVEFYVLAVIIGLVQGGIQALSRSYYTRIIPKERSAEYFGFYNMIGKFAAVFGPVAMGGVGLMVRAMGYSGDIASRASISAVSILFIAGGTLFFFVKEERGKEELRRLTW